MEEVQKYHFLCCILQGFQFQEMGQDCKCELQEARIHSQIFKKIPVKTGQDLSVPHPWIQQEGERQQEMGQVFFCKESEDSEEGGCKTDRGSEAYSETNGSTEADNSSKAYGGSKANSSSKTNSSAEANGYTDSKAYGDTEADCDSETNCDSAADKTGSASKTDRNADSEADGKTN